MAPHNSRQFPGKSHKSKGVLSVPASATQKRNQTQVGSMATKIAAPRLKLVIRRLPPALTESEFDTALGEEWKVNGGKVDWMVYKAGKLSTDPAKPSKPTCVYLHLTEAEYIDQLNEKVRTTTFNDAKGSSKDPCLLGPPTVEFSPYGRVPSDNPRQDARQGTIDQDQEFIDFLEGLTNPLPKKPAVDQEEETVTKSKEKVTTTPLIQFLRDKKANKGKEPSTGTKVGKHTRQDSKDSKTSSGSEKTPPKSNTVPSPEKRSTQAIKVENAARDAVKVLSKQASANNKKSDPSEALASPATTAPNAAPPSAPLAGKKRERGNASAAAKILQRDLGLRGGLDERGGRGGRRGGSVAPVKADAKPTAPKMSILASEPPTAATATLQDKPTVASPKITPAAPIAPSVTGKEDPAKAQGTNAPSLVTPPTGPAASRVGAKPTQQPRDNHATPTKPAGSPKGPTVSPTATHAFLKHANPSQGITEPLLEEAFAAFGTVKKVEIDKKKGFGYVDFAEPDGLQKAIQASPVKVGQGQVVVLERKTSPTSQSRNVRGGPAMATNRGGGVPLGPRGGRGGSMRRGGGPPRPPYNANAPKPSQSSVAAAAQPTAVLKNPASAAPASETKADSQSEPTGAPTATPET